ncbi:MAG: thiol-activated cytolysin family protein [Trueperaceae bacterium]
MNSTIKVLRWLSLLMLLLLLSACGQPTKNCEGPDCTPTPQPDPEPTQDQSVRDYLNSMSTVQKTFPPQEALDLATGDEYSEQITFGDTVYNCKRTPYNMIRTVDNFVVPTANNFLWPGAFLQGETLAGNLSDVRGLEIKERTPIVLVTNINGSPNAVSRNVQTPSLETISGAVDDLLSTAERDGATLSANTLWQKDSVTSTSVRSSLLGQGNSSRYLPSQVTEHFKFDQERLENLERQTIFAFYLAKPVTISMEPPASAADLFNADFTKAKLDERLASGDIATDNPIAYVSSVSYGQFVMLALEATASMGQLQSLLDEVLNQGKKIEELTPTQQTIWGNAAIKIYVYGGPQQQGPIDAVDPGTLREFTGVASFTQLRPVEYTITNLSDGSRVVLSEGTEYIRKECSAGAPPPDTSSLNAQYSGSGSNLYWSPVPEATSYIIERKIENGNYSFLTETNASQTSYNDTTFLQLDTGYVYRVRAVRDGAASTGVEAVVFTPPPAPSNFTATLENSSAVQLSWDAIPGATYRLEFAQYDRCSDNGQPYFQPLTETAETSYTHTSLDDIYSRGFVYAYKIIALKNAQQSTESSTYLALNDTPCPEPCRYDPSGQNCVEQ